MRICLYSTLREACGIQELIPEPMPATVRAALLWLGEQVPVLRPRLFTADGHLHERLVVFCNGRHIRFLQGEETPLQAQDVLALFPKTGEQRAFAHLHPDWR